MDVHAATTHVVTRSQRGVARRHSRMELIQLA
jgi:hypothetical protein